MSRRALRIGLLMHSLNPRGGVVHTLELADALVERGHEVTVLATAASGQTLFRPTRARLSLAPLLDLPHGLVPMVNARMVAMADHLRAQPALGRFDVLHSQDSITANALATLVDEGRIPGFVRTVHHLDHFEEAQLRFWQTRGVLAASQLCCVSALWQSILARDWLREAALVPNGVNTRRFMPEVEAWQARRDAELLARLGIQDRGPVWLAVGGVEARKNTVRLLQAFAQVQREASERAMVPGAVSPHALQASQAQLVIAGGASLLEHDACAAAFKAVCQAHGWATGQPDEHRVRLTGPLPDEALPALYRRATALAMPSVCEGFGLCVIEALACGTPAIASRVAPFTEHLAAHEVIWVDPLSVDSIAQALWRSLDPMHTAPVLASAPAVCARMDWGHSAARHEQVYAGLSQHRPSTLSSPSNESLHHA